jgi:hypothetical protein
MSSSFMGGSGEVVRPTNAGSATETRLIPKSFLAAGHAGRQPGPPRLDHAGTGVIDEDPPHRPGGGRNEVPAAVELLFPDQLQLGFVNEGGGIEGVAGGFGRHARGGELLQFVLDEREQLRGTLTASFRNGFDRTSDIRHFQRVYKSQDRPSRDEEDATLRSD